MNEFLTIRNFNPTNLSIVERYPWTVYVLLLLIMVLVVGFIAYKMNDYVCMSIKDTEELYDAIKDTEELYDAIKRGAEHVRQPDQGKPE